MMRSTLQDIHYAFHTLRKSPGFTAIAVLTLGLSIGANTAIFSVVNAVLVRPLPYKDAGRLTVISGTYAKDNVTHDVVSYPTYLDWKSQNRSFEGMEAWAGWSFNLSSAGQAEQIWGLRVTPGLFFLMGREPILGRGFRPEEQQPGRNHVLLLSHALWARRFGADPKILGTQIRLSADADSEIYTVVGVMPAGFQYTGPWDQAWVPLVPDLNRGHGFIRVVGRLKSGVTLTEAQAEMNSISAQLAKAYPRHQAGYGANVVPLRHEMAGALRPVLLVFLGAVASVLLIACANVASLLLARASARQRETAIRASLGASRRRLIRQFLTESVLLAAFGGVAGMLLAQWGVAGLVAFLSNLDIPIYGLDQIRIDPAVLEFTLLLSLATGLVFGMAPALEGSRTDVNETLKEGGRTATGGGGRARVRKLLVTCEVAMSLVLLAGAGLLMKSFLLLQRVPPGFRPEKLLTMMVRLPDSRYREPRKQVAFFDEVLAGIARLPGVRTVGAVNALPMSGNQDSLSFMIEGKPASQPTSAGDRGVNDGYFRAMGIRLVKGRVFTARDAAGSPKVAVINESMARRFWPHQDPIGQRISTDYKPPVWREIVGVVADVRHSNLATDPAPEMYFPYQQSPRSLMQLAVRTEAEPMSMANAVRSQVFAVDKDQPVAQLKTMERLMADWVAPQRFSLMLIGIFAALALALSTAGIYSVVSFAVTRRTREIGVRMALGADKPDVVRMIVSQGLAPVGAGIILGLGGALGFTRLLERYLYGVTPTDPFTFVCISALLGAVALVASYVPARRASQVDPVIALRYE
ncbi:MAG: hypothetical protein DMG57_26970 [Acidobacteria bacterium]|nr:MAG: hypothetical protein DMG57_26970 [Acidobacteriota bacterium]